MAMSNVAFIKWTGGLKSITKVKAHVKYVGFRSQEREEKGFFGRDDDRVNYNDFLKRIENNPALKHTESIKAHKLIFALKEEEYKAYKRSGKDFKDLARETLKQYENKYNVKLDWIGNIHNSDSR